MLRVGVPRKAVHMRTEITFSMDGASSAQVMIGCWLMPLTHHYSPRWVNEGDSVHLILLVRRTSVQSVVRKVRGMHPSVRLIFSREVVDAPGVEVESYPASPNV